MSGQLLFKPSESFKARLIADYDKIDETCCIAANISNGPTGAAIFALGGALEPENPFSYRVFSNRPSTNLIQNYGVSLQTDLEVGAFDITTISSYRAVRSDTNQDSDFTSLDIVGRNRGLIDIDTYTFEARVASSFDGPFNFLLGAFYFHENIDYQNEASWGQDFRAYAATASINPLTGRSGYLDAEATLAPILGFPIGTFGAAGQGVVENFDYRNRAISIFGEANFALTERLTLTAGFNYTRDRKNIAGSAVSTEFLSNLDLVAIGGGLLAAQGVPPSLIPSLADSPANPLLQLRIFQIFPPFLGFPNAVEDGRTRDNDLSYPLRAAYNFSDQLSGYLTYATGFKASSINLSRDSRPSLADFIPGSPITNPPPSPRRSCRNDTLGSQSGQYAISLRHFPDHHPARQPLWLPQPAPHLGRPAPLPLLKSIL